MNVTFTTRGFDLTDQIKKFATEKIKKIESVHELITATLTMDQNKHLYKAELLVHDRHTQFTAVQSTPDIYKSIHAVVEKVQKQVRRHKEKMIGRKRQAPAKGTKLAQNMGATGERTSGPRVIRSRKQDVKPMSQEEAVLQMESMKLEFLVYRDTGNDRICILFRRKDGNYGFVDSEI
jgi:putative sigma-54 modulation protein